MSGLVPAIDVAGDQVEAIRVWRATDDEICQVRFAENLRSQLSSYTDAPIVLPC